MNIFIVFRDALKTRDSIGASASRSRSITAVLTRKSGQSVLRSRPYQLAIELTDPALACQLSASKKATELMDTRCHSIIVLYDLEKSLSCRG